MKQSDTKKYQWLVPVATIIAGVSFLLSGSGQTTTIIWGILISISLVRLILLFINQRKGLKGEVEQDARVND